MKVVATKKGFYNNIRIYPGEKFSVPDGTKGSWFVPVAEYVPSPPPKIPGVSAAPVFSQEKEPETFSEITRTKSKKSLTDSVL